MSQQVRVREREGAQDGCPFCREPLGEENEPEVWACGTCQVQLHAACFRENQLRCTVLGCGGRAVVPPGASPPRRPSRREKKRRQRQQRRERERQARQQAQAAPAKPARTEPPHARQPRAHGSASWLQGPIGLAALLTLLFVVPLAGAEVGGVLGLSLVAIGFLGGLGGIVYLGVAQER